MTKQHGNAIEKNIFLQQSLMTGNDRKLDCKVAITPIQDIHKS